MGPAHIAVAHFRYTYFITLIESCSFVTQEGQQLLY